MRYSSVLVVIGACLAAVPAYAANARNPYSNIDPRLDLGGDTGDRWVETLNQAQLDAARRTNGAMPQYSPAPAPYGYAPAYPGGYAPYPVAPSYGYPPPQYYYQPGPAAPYPYYAR